MHRIAMILLLLVMLIGAVIAAPFAMLKERLHK
jgi:hypothetical protein